MPRSVCGIPLGGLGVRDRSLWGEWVKFKSDRERARRRWGGGGGTFVTGDARADAREEATIALERASSVMLPESSTVLELLLCDCPDIDAMLGVEARNPGPMGAGLLKGPCEGSAERGGSFGFSSPDGAEDNRELTEGLGLGAWSRMLPALDRCDEVCSMLGSGSELAASP